MLKIKDNINLKELEKFGFRKNMYDNYEKTLGKHSYDFLLINGYDRKIYFGFGVTELKADILFDLIKADMVEKVVEE